MTVVAEPLDCDAQMGPEVISSEEFFSPVDAWVTAGRFIMSFLD